MCRIDLYRIADQPGTFGVRIGFDAFQPDRDCCAGLDGKARQIHSILRVIFIQFCFTRLLLTVRIGIGECHLAFIIGEVLIGSNDLEYIYALLRIRVCQRLQGRAFFFGRSSVHGIRHDRLFSSDLCSAFRCCAAGTFFLLFLVFADSCAVRHYTGFGCAAGVHCDRPAGFNFAGGRDGCFVGVDIDAAGQCARALCACRIVRFCGSHFRSGGIPEFRNKADLSYNAVRNSELISTRLVGCDLCLYFSLFQIIIVVVIRNLIFSGKRLFNITAFHKYIVFRIGINRLIGLCLYILCIIVSLAGRDLLSVLDALFFFLFHELAGYQQIIRPFISIEFLFRLDLIFGFVNRFQILHSLVRGRVRSYCNKGIRIGLCYAQQDCADFFIILRLSVSSLRNFIAYLCTGHFCHDCVAGNFHLGIICCTLSDFLIFCQLI